MDGGQSLSCNLMCELRWSYLELNFQILPHLTPAVIFFKLLQLFQNTKP